MMAKWKGRILFWLVFLTSIYNNNACWMQGVDIWALQVGAEVKDIYSGIIVDRATENIDAIASYTFIELNRGPYLNVRLTDSRFIIETTDAFKDYEKYETELQISVTVNFRCSSGTTQPLVFVIDVIDTNNNPPEFLQANSIYTIYTPVAPGVIVTGCFDGIIVKDIDLTTERIEFAVEENPYFEIAIDEAASNTPKEFIGIIRTTAFIRTLPEPLTLTITATDVDRTGDPPRTKSTTVTFLADTGFKFPEEPVFHQAFYIANYNDANQIELSEPISLKSGFDEFVQFNLEGELRDHFELVNENQNQITLRVVNPLPVNVIREIQILLVVRANREYTSGDSATIVVHLPEEEPLDFDRPYNTGAIEDNVLRSPTLIITGYRDEILNFEIKGDYSSYFNVHQKAYYIHLTMKTLPEIIINENNVILLEVIASSEFRSASTIVALEIVKDDTVTPIFNKPLYSGSYNNETGLSLEQIVIEQGFDSTVRLSLEGEHSSLFDIRNDDNSLTSFQLVTTGSISPEIFNEQRILLTLHATKPRTVGANSVILITLPAARLLSFEESTYRGHIENNVLSLETIILSTGYEDTVRFNILGEFSKYFTITHDLNKITLNLATQIPDDVIQENNLIMLTIEASGLNAVSTTTTVLVDIIKADKTTPVFSRNIYYGTYQGISAVNIENINLAQGFGSDVIFDIEGEHAQYFEITSIENNEIVVALRSTIPEDVIFNEKALLFNIIARKPYTVGANAAISIRFPTELTEPAVMRFTQNTYKAEIENNKLIADSIILSTGYETNTQFVLTGDYETYFSLERNINNGVSLYLVKPLPIDEIKSNFIVLEVEAKRKRAVSVWTSIIVDIITQKVQHPIFTSTYYQGVYNEKTEIFSVEAISLAVGYDETVSFQLEGELASLFTITEPTTNTLAITTAGVPSEVLANNSHLILSIVANKPNTIAARATILIDIERESTQKITLGFDQVTYIGSIERAVVTLQPITLIEGYSPAVTFSLHGDLAEYFTISPEAAGVVRITLPTAIPDQSIPANRLIVLEIRAAAQQALTAYATIVFEVIVEDDQPSPSAPQLVFDATYYTGSYTNADGLIMNAPIVLQQGFDQTVAFDLEGEHAQWFSVMPTGNSVTLIVSSSIPAAVWASNSQLVFVITAQRTGSVTARATIIISLNNELTERSILGFDQVTYQGSIQSTVVTLQPITLIEGYSPAVTFSLHGDLAEYFTISPEAAGVVRITLPTAIPDQSIPANRLIVLEIRAAAQQALTAYATIVFEVIVEDDQPSPSAPQLVFDATYYTGSYTNADGLIMNAPIVLQQGFDQTVAFDLEGEHAQWFSVVPTGNSVTLIVSSSIPAAVLASNLQLVFVITAQRTGSETARATIIISLNDELTEGSILGFDQVTYQGSIQSTVVTLQPITLIEGYSPAVTFSLHGDLAEYFTISPEAAGVVRITLPTAIPDQSIPANRLIVLEIRAAAQQALTAYATIVFEVIVEDDQPSPSAPQLVFDATYYTGSYTNADGLIMNAPIVLQQGFDQTVAFDLEGEHAQWFSVVPTGNSVTLIVSSSIPAAVLASNLQLVFVITAQRTGSETARATIIISLNDELTEGSILGFDQVTYQGSIQSTVVTLQPITLIKGYSPTVTFSLHGDLAEYFTISPEAASVVRITLPTAIPDESIPANRLIVLEIRATAQQALTAYATIVFEVIVEDDQPSPSAPQLVFDATYYTGSYTNFDGLIMNAPIVLQQGYDQTVVFDLEGEHAQWFSVVPTGNSVTLIVSSSIPAAVLASNSQLVFVITAQRSGSDLARATVIISLTDYLQTGEDVTFDKLVYEGFIQLSAVQHESIIISNYNDINVELQGDYSSLFVAHVAKGLVTVQASGSLTLPDDVTHLALELHAADARAILLLNVVQSDVPVIPSVTFSSSSYQVNVNVIQTGLVGRVQATSDSSETLTYSLAISDEHLQARVSINNAGELYLSAPANSGSYTFQVIATTVITQVEGTATVYLTVEAVTVCGDDEAVVVPPLLILDRDEEEPHTNLVTLNTAQFEGCHFTLANRWPLDQNWLYVDDNGLHARSIDREHESIAFMGLSQVQVELILHCDTDNSARMKRTVRTDWLGPYDYGSNKWILTESIPYNARRSLVNLIVNDINDNAPIFVGKNLEPIIVGYPVGEIEERILPRSLTELQATDADIGENAALRYWSSEDVLAVAPTTGFVHVRSGAQLQDNQRLTVRATDRNGDGLTGDIQLLVKLLDLNNIAVVTVQDAFLDDEKTILAQLTSAIGYEVKTLRSVVISDEFVVNENEVSRKKRETGTAGASLLLYVYGILQSEPVVVERLTTDINNNAAVASILSTVSLEDHLPVETIYAERDIGFMVATIVLSVSLFIIIVITAIWFFLRWRKNKNYDQFTENNSLGSGSMEDLAKPETSQPRLNIEDLKRSEKRLQDMLNPPIEEITVEALSPRRDVPAVSIVEFSPPVESNIPFVIQSIDKLKDSEDTDEDEFGEKIQPRRKSVVTFNENVEKIIHVEDDIDTISTSSGYEIYKF